MNANLDKVLEDLCDHEGTRTDYQVFMSLIEHMDGNGCAQVPQKLIADETGCARRTVSIAVERLADKGFLTVEKTATDTQGVARRIASNIYHINPTYLTHTKSAHCDTKPQCSVCVKPCGSQTNEVHDLARLGVVMADVLKEIFTIYEENSK